MTVPTFKSLGKRVLLSQSIEWQIEEAILSRKLLPGTKLPTETELCQQFGVSRTSIREALRMLSSRGLISVVKGKGIFVKDFSAEAVARPLRIYLTLQYSKKYVLHVVHARLAIEPAMAALAAENFSDEDAQRLQRDFEAHRACRGTVSELAKLDMAFHLDIAKASGNPLMPLLLEPIHRLQREFMPSIYEVVEDAKESAVSLHTEIMEAILRRDADGARRAMEAHLEIAKEHAEALLKARRNGARQKTDGAE